MPFGAIALVAMLLASCTPEEASAPSKPPASSATFPAASELSPSTSTASAASPSPSDSGSEESESESERVLPAKWYVDTDGNEVPDFIESQEGYDPTINDCAEAAGCAGPEGPDVLQVLDVEQNTLLMLDASGSMAGDAGGGLTKMEAAREALANYAISTPEFVNLGFLVYGHRGSNEEAGKAESCAGIDVAAPLGAVDYQTFPDVLAGFQPTGYTPIAGALQRSTEVFAGRSEADNRVILVSDGIETCDGDPVAAAQALKAADIAVTVDVVGFDVGESEAAQLQAIADVTGGTYTSAQTGDQLNDYFRQQAEFIQALDQQALCVIDRADRIGLCTVDFFDDTVLAMRRIQNDSRDGPVIDAIGRITERALDVGRRQVDTNIADSNERTDEILRQIREAQDRASEVYDQQTSFVTPCRPLLLRFTAEEALLVS